MTRRRQSWALALQDKHGNKSKMEPPREVLTYYERFAEEFRLGSGPSRLEFERTKELLRRMLPKPRVRILDVGGRLACIRLGLHNMATSYTSLMRLRVGQQGAEAQCEARQANRFTLGCGARSLPQPDGFAEVVLLMGPLYHLTAAVDRDAALRDARRVLMPSGLLVVAAISRYASALDGLARGLATDPAFVRMRDRDLRDGQLGTTLTASTISPQRISIGPKICVKSCKSPGSTMRRSWVWRVLVGWSRTSRVGGRTCASRRHHGGRSCAGIRASSPGRESSPPRDRKTISCGLTSRSRRF